MKKPIIVSALLLALFAASPTFACAIVVAGTFRDAVEGASTVFTFRVDSLRLLKKVNGDWQNFDGGITILDVLHGTPPVFRRVRVEGICSDIRLAVGNIYMSATSQTGRTLQVETMDVSLVDVTREHYFGIPMAHVPSPTIDAVRAYYRHLPLPADFPDPAVVAPLHK